MKRKKVCPFDGKPCPHEGGCEVVHFDVEGNKEVIYRCDRFPIKD